MSSHITAAPQDGPERTPIEEILHHPAYEKANRTALKTLFVASAESVDAHFKKMIATVKSLDYVLENPYLAPWVYALKTEVHTRIFNHRNQRVIFTACDTGPKTEVAHEGRKVKIPDFIQLSWHNNSYNSVMENFTFHARISAASAKIERSTPNDLKMAKKLMQAAKAHAAATELIKPAKSADPAPKPRDAATDARITPKPEPGPGEQLRLF